MTSTTYTTQKPEEDHASSSSEPSFFELVDAVAPKDAPSANAVPDPVILDQKSHFLQQDAVIEASTASEDTPSADAGLGSALLEQISRLLHTPAVVEALAARTHALLKADPAGFKRTIVSPPAHLPSDVLLSALTLLAAVRAALSTSPPDPSILARDPALAALAANPASDPGARAFAHVFVHSELGEEIARRAVEIYVNRVRDWLLNRAARVLPVYGRVEDTVREGWAHVAEWAPTAILGGSMVGIIAAMGL